MTKITKTNNKYYVTTYLFKIAFMLPAFYLLPLLLLLLLLLLLQPSYASYVYCSRNNDSRNNCCEIDYWNRLFV